MWAFITLRDYLILVGCRESRKVCCSGIGHVPLAATTMVNHELKRLRDATFNLRLQYYIKSGRSIIRRLSLSCLRVYRTHLVFSGKNEANHELGIHYVPKISACRRTYAQSADNGVGVPPARLCPWIRAGAVVSSPLASHLREISAQMASETIRIIVMERNE